MDFKFNINYNVKVKLTDYGVSILKQRHYDLDQSIRAHGGKGLGEFKDRRDKEGYQTFQMWSLMETFGEYMSIGSPLVFETEIIIMKGEPLS